MAEMTSSVGFREGGVQPPVSRGSVAIHRFIGRMTFNASVASGGDTLPLPGVPSTYTLRGVVVTPSMDGTNHYSWDGNLTTPKVHVHDAADGTASNIGAEVTGDLSAITVTVELIYEG